MAPLVYLLTMVTLGRGFNLEPRHAVVLDDPESDHGSYFGYALGFWRQSIKGRNSTWLLVGAPQAQEAGLRGERVRQPGAVYKCSVHDLDNEDAKCYKLSILSKEDRQEQDLRWRWKIVNIPKRSWIGATITTENEPNGAVVVCAPRMKQMVQRDTWFIPGMCYYWKTDEIILPLAPLESAAAYRSGANYRRNGFHIGLAQSGMSAHFVVNSTTSQLVVGATGVDYFTGAMNVYEQDLPHSNVMPSLHAPLLPTVPHDSYLGYSVSSAKLHSDGRVSYLAGAPRGKGLDYFTGVVHVMSGAHQSSWLLQSQLEGQQMGEYFGACVTSMDYNFDGVDDLVLVGAPLHSLRQSSTIDTGEQGRLYVYRNVKQGRLELAPVVLTGSSVPGARFASSVSVIGDLNRDGYNDIAVGAPYEEGGAVYIYLGSRHGLSNIIAQRISASEIRSDLSGFGYSLASGIDIDGNSFTDLAVGSYESANAVIVRSYPVIEMEAYLRPAVSNLDVNAKSVTIKACVEYTTNANPNLLAHVEAVAILKADSTLKRAVLESGGHEQETHLHLQREVTHCWDNHVTLKGNLIQKMQPVEFSLYYKVADNPSSKQEGRFCKMCPVTDPLKPTSVHIKIPFANGCEGKSMCLADLKVEVKSSNKGRAIVLGEDEAITLAVSVVNQKEPAYLVKMSLNMPKSTSLVKMPKHCYQEDEESLDDPEVDVIICGLGNILESDQLTQISERTTKFQIDITGVGLETSQLVFNVTTWSASEEKMPTDNTKIITVPVKLASEMDITGNTMQKHLVLSSTNENLPSTISVVHKYEVTNFGPSPIGEINISSSLPFGLINDETFGMIIFGESINPQITIRGHTVRCGVDYSTLNVADSESRRKREVSALEANETETYLPENIYHLNCTESGVRKAACALVTCTAGPLGSGDTAEMKLQFNINRTMIDRIQQKDIQISSSAWMKVPDEYEIYSGKRLKMANVATLLVGNFEESVSPWVLIVSAVIGLFLLAFMITILSKIGFFHRKYKEDMENMRDAAEEFAYQKFLPEFESNIFF